jgi:hypothetical protein
VKWEAWRKNIVSGDIRRFIRANDSGAGWKGLRLEVHSDSNDFQFEGSLQ